MSIKDQVDRIAKNISESYDEAIAKGATAPSEKNSKNLPAAIKSIPTGAGTLQKILNEGNVAITDYEGEGVSDYILRQEHEKGYSEKHVSPSEQVFTEHLEHPDGFYDAQHVTSVWQTSGRVNSNPTPSSSEFQMYRLNGEGLRIQRHFSDCAHEYESSGMLDIDAASGIFDFTHFRLDGNEELEGSFSFDAKNGLRDTHYPLVSTHPDRTLSDKDAAQGRKHLKISDVITVPFDVQIQSHTMAVEGNHGIDIPVPSNFNLAFVQFDEQAINWMTLNNELVHRCVRVSANNTHHISVLLSGDMTWKPNLSGHVTLINTEIATNPYIATNSPEPPRQGGEAGDIAVYELMDTGGQFPMLLVREGITVHCLALNPHGSWNSYWQLVWDNIPNGFIPALGHATTVHTYSMDVWDSVVLDLQVGDGTAWLLEPWIGVGFIMPMLISATWFTIDEFPTNLAMQAHAGQSAEIDVQMIHTSKSAKQVIHEYKQKYNITEDYMKQVKAEIAKKKQEAKHTVTEPKVTITRKERD